MGAEDGGTMIGGTMYPTGPPDQSGWWFGYVPQRLNAPQGQWNHVCMTWDGDAGIGKFYMDGALAETTEASSNHGYGASGPIPGVGNPVYIGKAGIGNWNENFNGLIDNVRLYERTLDASDVS